MIIITRDGRHSTGCEGRYGETCENVPAFRNGVRKAIVAPLICSDWDEGARSIFHRPTLIALTKRDYCDPVSERKLAMLAVHYLGISQSDRIVWLCEELGLPYELIRYDRDPVTKLAPDSYRALHPFGTAPVIVDGDLALGESGAIIDYVIAKYGEGRLSRTVADPDFADYLFWFHFANGSMMPGVACFASPGARMGRRFDSSICTLTGSSSAQATISWKRATISETEICSKT